MKVTTGRLLMSAVVALALAACGGDDDATEAPATSGIPAATEAAPAPSSSAATETTASLAGTAASTPASSDEPAAAAGEPIKFMTIATLESPNFSVPQVQTAVQARVDAINASGGIDGRPLEVEFCNDKFDPNEGAACARKAGEAGAVAIVGGTTAIAGNIFPTLTEAGIPWLAGGGSSGTVEITDPISYPIHGASASMLLGVGHSMTADHGAQSVSILADDNAGSQTGAELMKQGVESAGGTAEIFTAPAGTVDYAGLVAQALTAAPDGVGYATAPDSSPKAVQAVRQSGFDGVEAAANSLIPQAAVDALGADAEGIYLGFRMVPTSNTDNPEVAQFLEEMGAADPSVRIDELGLNAWTGVNFLAAIAAELDTVDAASIRAYLDDLPAPIELGTVPDYGSLEAPAEFPRAVNFVCILGRVEGGTIVQDGDFFNPLEN